MEAAERTWNRHYQEWTVARKTVDGFDKILVDLRKFGFSFITGLLTAQSLLGAGTPTSAQVLYAAIAATIGLIVVLYWMDRLYETMLYGAVYTATKLENHLQMSLTGDISYVYGKMKSAPIPHLIYFGFASASLLIYYWLTGGWIVLPFIVAILLMFPWGWYSERKLRIIKSLIGESPNRLEMTIGQSWAAEEAKIKARRRGSNKAQ
jgi:hypothetical protein